MVEILVGYLLRLSVYEEETDCIPLIRRGLSCVHVCFVLFYRYVWSVSFR